MQIINLRGLKLQSVATFCVLNIATVATFNSPHNINKALYIQSECSLIITKCQDAQTNLLLSWDHILQCEWYINQFDKLNNHANGKYKGY